jgi:hypothetical protein
MFANRFYALVSGSVLRIFSRLARFGTGDFSRIFSGWASPPFWRSPVFRVQCRPQHQVRCPMRGMVLGLVGLALLHCGPRANADIVTGLAAYYPFNGNANDASGTGNNGVVTGATLTADRFGNANSAYSFDGNNDYIRTAYSQTLDFTGDLTISAWVRTSQAGAIIFSNMLETSPHSGYSLRLALNGDIHFMSGDMSLIGKTPVNTNRWTHVAVTLSGTTATSFVNGVLDTSETVGVPVSSSVDQTIGASDSPHYFWNGAIDDVRVYNRALSFSEIGTLYTIPEPSSFVLLGVGSMSLLAYVWRRRKRTT